MRFLSRLQLCGGMAILLIVYFIWEQNSNYIPSSIQSIWRGKPRRIVVFGDDWSDTGDHRVSPLSHSRSTTRDPDRGDVWVETLCKELACNTIDNFARSIPLHTRNTSIGCVLDSDIHSMAVGGKGNDGAVNSTDLKTQVQQFLTYDRASRSKSKRLLRDDEWTIFAVFFGLWDLLVYSTLENEFAMRAIDNSIAVLFKNLNLLAEHASAPIKVIIPSMMDVTFLPRVQAEKNATREHFAENQHRLIFLWTYWNSALLRTASQWENGDVFMPDLNFLIMDQVRVKQLYSKHISDAFGVGKQAPLFDNVEQPCLASMLGPSTTDQEAAAIIKCIDPAQHLFWDDLQLSGAAHRQIGIHAASLLRSGQSVNIEQKMQDPANIARPVGQEGGSFNLKFPPGY